jgi:hypothetical protein
MIRDNVIATNPSVTGTAITCSDGFARDNAVGRISTALVNCVDGGGNLEN